MFLQSKDQEEIQAKMVSGFEMKGNATEEPLVAKPKKILCRLTQRSKRLNKRFHENVIQIGSKPTTSDLCNGTHGDGKTTSNI